MNKYVADKFDAHRKAGDILEGQDDGYVVIIEVPSKDKTHFTIQELSTGAQFYVGALALYDYYKHVDLTGYIGTLLEIQSAAHTVSEYSKQFFGETSDKAKQAQISYDNMNTEIHKRLKEVFNGNL